MYNSWPELKKEKQGDCGKGCDEVDVESMPSGRFQRGKQYPCWKARVTADLHCESLTGHCTFLFLARQITDRLRGGSVADQCGNDQCYKLNDPASLPNAATRRATAALTLGGGLLLGGLLSCCLFSYLLTRRHRELLKYAAEETAVPTVHVISATDYTEDDPHSGAPKVEFA